MTNLDILEVLLGLFRYGLSGVVVRYGGVGGPRAERGSSLIRESIKLIRVRRYMQGGL